MAIKAGMMKGALARKAAPPPQAETLNPAGDETMAEAPEMKDTQDREEADLNEAVQLLEGIEHDDPKINAKLDKIVADLKALIAEESGESTQEETTEMGSEEPV